MQIRAHAFLNEWATFRPRTPRQALRADLPTLRPLLDSHTVVYRTWGEVISDPDFGTRTTRLHLSLLPQPFIGDPRAASVFVLALNPGFHLTDYYAEFTVPEFRAALANSLRCRFDDRFPHVFLNPTFAWHTGFSYWHGRLATLITQLATDLSTSRIDALSFVSRSFANIELVPYHSASFGLPSRVVDSLHSASLARGFVSEVLVPLARDGEVLLICTRQAARWSLPIHPNIVVYEATEARAAYLTPNSRGGRAILGHLRDCWNNAA